jgi:hypothetical protein
MEEQEQRQPPVGRQQVEAAAADEAPPPQRHHALVTSGDESASSDDNDDDSSINNDEPPMYSHPDELFDAQADEEDEAYVYRHLRCGREESVSVRTTTNKSNEEEAKIQEQGSVPIHNKNKKSSSAKVLEPCYSDAILSCPCFFTLCAWTVNDMNHTPINFVPCLLWESLYDGTCDSSMMLMLKVWFQRYYLN